jgi:hypothetical protein
VEGRVLAIEGKDVIVDIARATGAAEGDELEMFRPLTVRHPVTRRTIIDRYRIGELKLTQVRDRIALGRASGSLLRQPAVGDIVVRTGRVPASEPPSRGTPEDGDSRGPAPRSPTEASTGELNVLFDALHGATLARRIRAYERYAASHPASPYSRTLVEEAAALRELIAARASPSFAGTEGEARPSDAGEPVALHFVAPDTTVERRPLSIGIELGGSSVGGVLSLRTAGEVAFRTLPMQPSGDGYFAVVIPADRVLAPAIQYFIEATRPSGDAVLVAGTPEKPIKTRVERAPQAAAPLSQASSVTLVSDYADYNRLHGNDRVFQTEGTFGMRFDEVGVRALRTGFGVYRGVGGSIDALDRLGLAPRRVGFTYGHIEGEFGIKPTLSLVVRAVVGLGDDGTSGGAQLHLRIGSDRSTNLTFGGEVLGGVGLRGISELQLQPLGRFPVLVRSEVTNQPAGAAPASATLAEAAGRTDIGIRAIVQVGYRPVDALMLALRGSYQGRTIDHSGPGLGAAVEYRW